MRPLYTINSFPNWLAVVFGNVVWAFAAALNSKSNIETVPFATLLRSKRRKFPLGSTSIATNAKNKRA